VISDEWKEASASLPTVLVLLIGSKDAPSTLIKVISDE